MYFISFIFLVSRPSIATPGQYSERKDSTCKSVISLQYCIIYSAGHTKSSNDWNFELQLLWNPSSSICWIISCCYSCLSVIVNWLQPSNGMIRWNGSMILSVSLILCNSIRDNMSLCCLTRYSMSSELVWSRWHFVSCLVFDIFSGLIHKLIHILPYTGTIYCFNFIALFLVYFPPNM